jgi:hypothetical protein
MTEPTPSGWGPCPAGELSRMAGWLAWRRRLRAATVVAAALLGSAAATGAGWLVYSEFRDEPPPPCEGEHFCGVDTTAGAPAGAPEPARTNPK